MYDLMPDYPIDAIAVKDIHYSLLINGCCLLRGALDPASIIKLSNQIEPLYQKKAHLARTANLTDDAIKCHVFEPEFQENYPGQSLYDLIENTKLYQLLESLFGVGKIHHSTSTNCRSVDARTDASRDITSFGPLLFHIDAPYHPPFDKFTVNFWIPLNEGCGVIRPGIQVLPMDHLTVRRLLGFDPKIGFTDPAGDETVWGIEHLWNRLAVKCEGATIWRPRFSIGDVMVMTSWIPHASYAPDNAPNARRNLEIRHHGESLDPLPVMTSSADSEVT